MTSLHQKHQFGHFICISSIKGKKWWRPSWILDFGFSTTQIVVDFQEALSAQFTIMCTTGPLSPPGPVKSICLQRWPETLYLLDSSTSQ